MKLVVVNVLGKDTTGIVAGITKEIAARGANIVDIEQSVIRGLFSMFLLVDPLGADLKDLKTALVLQGKKRGVGVSVSEIHKPHEYLLPDTCNYIITVLGADKPGIVAGVSGALADVGVNIVRIKMVARGDLLAMELAVDGTGGLGFDRLRERLRKIGEKIGVDIIMQSEDDFRHARRLVVFDMDSTLIDMEVIDELAKHAGVGKQVSKITKRAMNGHIEYKDALRERAGLLRGMDLAVLDEIANNLRFTPGSEDLITTLKEMGYKVALISGGFTYFTDRLKGLLGLDYAYANKLVVVDGKLTGEVEGDIIDKEAKGRIIKEIAAMEGISMKHVVAIGDGANDQIMLENAGLGIAFNAKDILKDVADGSLTKNNLKGLMYCLGINKRR
ncbi:MAG: phosphoserine phosphatase SerB [Candidatus Altiarchaeales archaeon IMC4]|nr:MAG: phosphoserine phosphatase SerB [Candidatus Altiarchaeales archaeon IMC4]